MSSHFLPLSIKPLQRLQVNNGLLLTAEHWRLAHDYHRQRQNIYYQSLHQAGIVSGLGVCVIPPPSEVAQEYRDGRWLLIQPGVAIDHNGNPIIVPQPLAFHIASESSISGSLVVYVVINYVDPDRLQGLEERQLLQETFRIDEKITSPNDTDVELCRVLLEPGEVQLEPATDVLNPEANQLDLRYRKLAQVRSLEQVRVAQVIPGQTGDAVTFAKFSYLMQSVTALYPAIQGTINQVTLQAGAEQLDYDLLYFTLGQLLTLQESERQSLRQYLAGGAVILLEVSIQEANIVELSAVRQQLRFAIANLTDESEIASVRQEIEAELNAVESNLTQQLQEFSQPIRDFAEDIGINTANSDTLSCNHSLRNQPFLFAQLPIVQNYPIHLFNWGGIVLIVGSLSSAWGIDDTLSLSRETIRTAQEMGINILHFAWHRHQLTQLQQIAKANG
ncbi:MAG: hypothetical protein V7K67_32070 [Nostoc sp.]|uniref:hypothetical protein n=1 Tax=Nostoc sp. TaxID=1180 RepID=UPI002FFC2A94